jgi:phosphoglycerate dehydrogenase-like enzyme
MESKRLKVLFLMQAAERRDPWVRDVLAAIDPGHNVAEFDPAAPLEPQFAGADVVVDQGGNMGTRAMADLCSSLKLWQILGTGFDKFDLAYWEEKGIPVANTPGQFSAVPLAECALMYMLMLSRRWHETQAHLRQGAFYIDFGEELLDRRLLLLGFGASARELALRVRPFGMRTAAIDIRDIPEEEQREFGLEITGKPADLDALLGSSDFVSLHLHLNADTRGILDARRIALMKPGAFLINVARGALVDESALYGALASGRLGGAGLDVFAAEPLDPNSPILRLPNVIATPHISGTTHGTSRRRARCVAENIERIAQGSEPLYRIDHSPALAGAGRT